MINKYAVLLRKNVILDSGIKTLKDENLLVNFDAFLLDTSAIEDPNRVLLPSTSRVIEIVEELKDVAANTKWINTIEGITELPDSATIQDAYDNDSLIVKDIVDGSLKALAKDVKDVTFEDENGQSITLTTIQASINDGILYDLPTNGKFETAVFTASGWKIDTSKNFIPSEINRLDGEVVNLKAKVTELEAKDVAIEARLSDQGVFITQANTKDIQGKGTIAISGTPTEANKIPTRAEVGSMGATLNQSIEQAQTDATSANTKAVNAQSSATDALAKATDADQKATAVSSTAATAAQDAHDAKVAAAKANDDLAIEVAARKAADLVIDGKVTTNTTAIATNTQTIAANKAILDTVKAQADLDHQDLATNIKPTLTAAAHTANEAMAYGQDWNTSKGQVAMKSELDVKAVIDLKGRPITKAGTNSYKIDFGAWNGNPALDLTGVSDGVKAIINIHRTTQTDPVQNRYNDLIDQHYNDATSDGTCTVYLADSLTTLEKTQYTATVVISNTQATFSFAKADGTTANLNAAQEAVILAYQAVTITFEGTGTQAISVGDDVARGQIVALTQTVNTNTAAIAGKQAALDAAQLAVVNALPFTQTVKTGYDAVSAVQVKVNATDAAKALSAVTAAEVVAGVAYVDAKVAAAGVPASVTQDIDQLKGVKVQKNGTDLETAKVALSAMTSADLLVDKTYADAIVAPKQDSTIPAIAGATTVVGALTAINTVAQQAKTAVEAIDLTVKQNVTDNSLTTTDKTIPGAINEIVTWKTSAITELAKLNLDDTHLLELEALVA